MSRAIASLKNEHRLIEQVLGSLQTFADRLSAGQPGAREHVAAFARFFREFADRKHHGKEEDRLFVAMAEYGFPSEGGPVFVMLREHETGRSHVRALAEAGAGDGELTESETAIVKNHACEFVAMLSAHIRKEDMILFPAAERAMPASVLDTLAGRFDEFDATVIGPQQQEQLHQLAQTLIEAFPSREESR